MTSKRSKLTMQDIRQDPVVKRHLIGFALCGVALIFDIALSFSPMYWYRDVKTVGFQSTITYNIGLWKACYKGESAFGGEPTSKCYEHDSEDFPYDTLGGRKAYQLARMLGVTQLFQCLGLLFLSNSIVLIALKLFKWRENNLLTPMAAAHAFWGAVSFIGSAGAFGTGLKILNTPEIDETENLHFSFAFAAICGFVALAGALTLIIAAKTTNETPSESDPESTNRLDIES